MGQEDEKLVRQIEKLLGATIERRTVEGFDYGPPAADRAQRSNGGSQGRGARGGGSRSHGPRNRGYKSYNPRSRGARERREQAQAAQAARS